MLTVDNIVIMLDGGN